MTSRTALHVSPSSPSPSQRKKTFDVASRTKESYIALQDSLADVLQRDEEELLGCINERTTPYASPECSEDTKKGSSGGPISFIRSRCKHASNSVVAFFGKGTNIKWAVAFSILTIISMPKTMLHKYAALTSNLFSATFWGSFAPFTAIGMSLAPIPTMKRILRENDVGGLPLLPYSSMFTLCFILTLYGTCNCLSLVTLI